MNESKEPENGDSAEKLPETIGFRTKKDDDQLYAAILEAAKLAGVNKSEMIRQALEVGLELAIEKISEKQEAQAKALAARVAALRKARKAQQ